MATIIDLTSDSDSHHSEPDNPMHDAESQLLERSSQAEEAAIPSLSLALLTTAFTSRIGDESSSRNRPSDTEADYVQFSRYVAALLSSRVGEASSSRRRLSADRAVGSSQLDLLSLPSDMCHKEILSRLPIQKLIECSAVCKGWMDLILSGRLSAFGYPLQPSTRNGAILVLTKEKPSNVMLADPEAPVQVMETYNSRLNMWQDQVMRHFIEGNDLYQDGCSAIKVSTSGGLLYRYSEHKSDMIDIVNPITTDYRRLTMPQAAEVQLQNSENPILLGIIVEEHLNTYYVIVLIVRRLPDAFTMFFRNYSEPFRLLVYNSASRSWTRGGCLPRQFSWAYADRIGSSTFSEGSLYVLTRIRGRIVEWSRPRCLKYNARDRTYEEISPVPHHYKWRYISQPVLFEHRGDILYVRRNRTIHDTTMTVTWSFFRLRQNAMEGRRTRFVLIREMPPDVYQTMLERMKHVHCHGGGDLVYFYGQAYNRPRGFEAHKVTRVLVHDLVKNTWVWLADYSHPEGIARCDLISMRPSFVKAN